MEYFLVLLKSKWKIYDNFLNFPKFTTKFVRSLNKSYVVFFKYRGNGCEQVFAVIEYK
jgi:hypothetical protein